MLSKEHLSSEGLQQIINLKAIMNKGISDELKINFPNFKLIERPFNYN
jgi:hypothetical protein